MTRFAHITVADAQRWLSDTKGLVVDIRDHTSYESGHIEGAIHLNDNNLADFLQTADMDQPLLVYCYHGNASQPAAQFLMDQGFEQTYSLVGGYAAWSASE